MPKKSEPKVVRIATVQSQTGFFVELMDTSTPVERWLRLGFTAFPTFESARDWVKEKGFILLSAVKPFVYQSPRELSNPVKQTKGAKKWWLGVAVFVILLFLLANADTNTPQHIKYVPDVVANPER